MSDTTDYAALDWRAVDPATADARALEVAIAKASGIISVRKPGTHAVSNIETGEWYWILQDAEGKRVYSDWLVCDIENVTWQEDVPRCTTDPAAALGLLEEMRVKMFDVMQTIFPVYSTPGVKWLIIIKLKEGGLDAVKTFEGDFMPTVARCYLAAMQAEGKP